MQKFSLFGKSSKKEEKEEIKKEVSEDKLIEGAKTAVKTCMNVKKGETVLIITDTEKERIGNALFQESSKITETILLKMLPRTRHGEEPPFPIAEIMKTVDVIFAPTKYSLSHTQARKIANKNSRIATLPGITEDMFSSGGMTANFRDVEKAVKKLHKKIQNSKEVKITTKLGTDLTIITEGREWIADDTGICHKKGDFTNLPAGELFIAPVENKANGILFIDGAFGSKLEKEVKVIIENGFAKEFFGGEDIVKELDKRGKVGRNIAELGIGMNPNAKIIGNILEDEKVLGTCHIAFGDNSTFGGKTKAGIHIDGIVKKPTIVVDGKTIMEDGGLKF